MTAVAMPMPHGRSWDGPANRATDAASTPHADNRATASDPPRLADWQHELLRRAEELAGLDAGWDGAGAPAPTERAVLAAGGVIASLPLDVLPPYVMPTTLGGVQIEWHAGGWDVEIEATPLGDLETWIRFASTGYQAEYVEGWNDDIAHAIKDLTANHQS